MKALVVGASGATGQHVVKQLLRQGCRVKAIIRPNALFPDDLTNNVNLELIHAHIHELSQNSLIEQLTDCDAIASCLGHNLSFKGIYGKPRLLVTDSVKHLCNAAKAMAREKPIKFILMNTTGNRNRDLNEPISMAQHCILGLIRLLVPPHVDNEKAADYLRTEIGQAHPVIEWVVVRPDTLINEQSISNYELYPSPTRSAIFDAGQTSRVNVGHFMTQLLLDNALWEKWKGQMPVIYNSSATNL